MSELHFHPIADLFPLMEGAEFEELVADIKASGLRERIDLYQGKIADGRNRYRALLRLGLDPSADQKQYFRKAIHAHSAGGEIAAHEQSNDDKVRAYIISKNIHRRHLTPEQKRDLLVKLVAAQPEKADRVIAREAKVDHKQVSRARRKAEATGAIAPVEKRTGADGKARKQPAKKRKPGGTQLEQDRKECIALYQKLTAAEREAELGHECVTATSDGSHWVCDGCGKRVAKSCGCPAGATAHAEVVPVENAPPPDVGAEIMKAKMAALDNGADPGPMPEIIRRTA
jgi:hypothetical protein